MCQRARARAGYTPHQATFSKSQAHPGTLAWCRESGALCTAILDWADVHDVGFSMLVSLGQAADVGLGEVLDYLAPRIHVVTEELQD